MTANVAIIDNNIGMTRNRRRINLDIIVTNQYDVTKRNDNDGNVYYINDNAVV